MKHDMPLIARRPPGIVLCAGLLTVAVAICFATVDFSRAAPPAAATTVAGSALVAEVKRDPNIMGYARCMECHKSEVAAWQHSTHSNTSARLADPKAMKFAAALGIANVQQSLCTNCHGTERGDAEVALIGYGNVSCETCHSPSGPEKSTKGWFSVHSLPADKLPAEKRIAYCDAAGMNRSADIYELAKNCYQCHTVMNEKLVDTAKHPAGKPEFDFLNWSQGEVRHNFQADQTKNAEAPTTWLKADPARTAKGRHRLMFIAGKIADLEVNVRKRATAGDWSGQYAQAASARIAAALDILGLVQEVAPTDDVAAVIKIGETVQGSDDQETLTKAADAIGKWGVHFVATHKTGEKIAALDDILPDLFQPQGTPYQP